MGNDDGVINGSEVIEIFPSIKNFGSEDAENVTGILSTENPNVLIIDSLVSYGNLSSNESVVAANPFVFSVSNGLHPVKVA